MMKHGTAFQGANQDRLQAIHDHAQSMGAQCGSGDEGKSRAVKFAAKYAEAMGMNPDQYAAHECNDIQDAAQILYGLAGLAAGEAYSDEPDEVKHICDLMRGLLSFILGEIDEVEQNGSSLENNIDEGKGYFKRDYSTEDRQRMAKEGTAKPDGSYPIANRKDLENAVHAWGRGGARESDKEWIIHRARALNATDLLPADWSGSTQEDNQGKSYHAKNLSLNYVKALHLPYTEQQFRDQLAVKFIGHDEIIGACNLYGSENEVDSTQEFFTAHTDFWTEELKSTPRPLTWEHGLDRNFKARPVVGNGIDFTSDEIANWYHAAMNRKHQYFNYISKMIGDRDLGFSSDSAPQYVERVVTKSGAVWLKTWPVFAVALTTTPAEPRLIGNVEFWKSLGVTLPNAQAMQMASRELPEDLRREGELLRIRFS